MGLVVGACLRNVGPTHESVRPCLTRDGIDKADGGIDLARAPILPVGHGMARRRGRARGLQGFVPDEREACRSSDSRRGIDNPFCAQSRDGHRKCLHAVRVCPFSMRRVGGRGSRAPRCDRPCRRSREGARTPLAFPSLRLCRPRGRGQIWSSASSRTVRSHPSSRCATGSAARRRALRDVCPGGWDLFVDAPPIAWARDPTDEVQDDQASGQLAPGA
jgi:hypothetical protein